MMPTTGDIVMAPYTDETLYQEQLNKTTFWQVRQPANTQPASQSALFCLSSGDTDTNSHSTLGHPVPNPLAFVDSSLPYGPSPLHNAAVPAQASNFYGVDLSSLRMKALEE